MVKVTEEFVEQFFENISDSLFRLETLQDYSAEDGEETVSNFIKTGEIGFDISKLPFWQYIKELNNKEIETSRVKIIKYPLSDYIKFSLEFFKQASKYSGDKVYIINQIDFEKLNLPKVDYWLKDNKYLLIGTYGNKGKLLYWEYSDKTEDISKYIEEKNILISTTKLL